jgi:N4-gp56 family major capsid protein
MPLPTDELIRKATTNTTTLNALIPQLWAAQIERNLRKHAVFEQSAVVNGDLLVPNAGNVVYIPILPDLGPAGALTEGTDMTVNALNTASSVAMTPSEYGTTIEITRKALDRIKYDGAAAIMDRLSYAMSQTIEGAFAALYNASVPGTANKMTTIYANGKASGTITTSDTFNDALILAGIKTLQQANNFPFPDNYWRLYINPAQWANLLQDTNTRQDLRWAAPDRLLNGEVGTLHGCRIIVTNYIVQTLEGAGSNVPANKAMLIAPRWACIAYKRKPEAVVDPTLYDMGRRRRFGITADFDIELLHNERGVVLCSSDV